MDQAGRDRLEAAAGGRVRFAASLADLTTFGLGGPAAALVQPEEPAELARVLDLVHREGWPWFILGGGSNVLFRDGGFPGVVIRLGNAFSRLEVLTRTAEEILVRVGAAAPTAALVTLARREGLTGVEFLAGIPGWIGGALAMNAGAHGGQIMDVVLALEVMDLTGRLLILRREELDVGYRRVALPQVVVLATSIRLRPGNREEISARIEEIQERRRSRQPQGTRNAGCVFRNPTEEPAGRLIDRAGLKGRRIGGAWVAEEHANFIVHRGGARASEVVALLEMVRAEVANRFGIGLETEIKIIGVDEETSEK